jgi:hypothetical protein
MIVAIISEKGRNVVMKAFGLTNDPWKKNQPPISIILYERLLPYPYLKRIVNEFNSVTNYTW